VQLKEAEFQNFRQHEHLVVPIKGHLIGIVGPNGRGKSNLIAGLQYALTGDVPGVVKENLLRWGTESGFVKLRFEHDGNDVLVCRGVGTADTWMRLNGGKPLKGIVKVNEALLDLAGLDKDVGRMMFVAQKMLDQVLFDLPSKREQAFQRLCGMGDATKINRDVGNFLSVRMAEVPNYDEQIAEANRQQVEFAQQLSSLDVQLQQVGASNPAVSVEQLQAHVGECDVGIPMLMRLYDNVTSQQTLQQKRVVTEQQIAALLKDGADTSLDAIDDEVRKLDDLIQKAATYQQAAKDYQTAADEQSHLGDPPYRPEDVAELKAAYEQLSQAYHETSGRVALYKQLQIALSGTAVQLTECPVCGSTIHDAAFVRDHLAGLIKQAEQEAAANNPHLAKGLFEDARGKLVVYDTRKSRVAGQVQNALTVLQRTQAIEGDVAALIAQKQQERSGIRAIRQDIAQKQMQLTALQGTLNALQQQMTQNEANWNGWSASVLQFLQGRNITGVTLNDPAQITTIVKGLELERSQAKTALNVWQQYQINKANLEGQIKQVQGNQLRMAQTLKDLEYKRSQQGAFRGVVDTLTRVRDFFHYTNGPHRLSVSILNEMNRDVNMFLQKLNAPYSVTAHDTGLTYLCQFQDGRPMPQNGYMEATELSGGEKVLLAVSFRLASYMMFASKMGLLSLDEPTAYLDDNNIANFCELLNTLKDLARSLNLQLIMSTHERSTIPFMDSVIDLTTVEELNPNDSDASRAAEGSRKGESPKEA
jgi:DNA repair exonuclease SbcCD ATPase subunit